MNSFHEGSLSYSASYVVDRRWWIPVIIVFRYMANLRHYDTIIRFPIELLVISTSVLAVDLKMNFIEKHPNLYTMQWDYLHLPAAFSTRKIPYAQKQWTF